MSRVDTVHQGDRDGEKGVYPINLVDEVTQFEFVGAVVGISERFLVPLLEGLLLSFPFPILGFHADNGSEYINHRVAALLEKLRVGAVHQVPGPAFQRQRAGRGQERQCDPQVVRPRPHPAALRARGQPLRAGPPCLPFLNVHRPCLFATEYRDNQGRIRRKYLAEHVMTPYAKLRSLADAEHLLKPGVRFALLDAMATAETDLEAVRRVQARAARPVPAHRRRQHGRPSRWMMGGGWATSGGGTVLWICGRVLRTGPRPCGPLAHNSTGTTTNFFTCGLYHRNPCVRSSPIDWLEITQVTRDQRGFSPNHPVIAQTASDFNKTRHKTNFTLTFSLDSGARGEDRLDLMFPWHSIIWEQVLSCSCETASTYMSLFAHIVSRSLAPEPAATQALEYILQDSLAREAFLGMFAPIGVSFEPRSVESEKAHGDGQPDLTIYDTTGKHRLFVENKFWAGLTPAQPATYLAQLQTDEEVSGLVFIVPEDRVRSIWAELRRRCAEVELAISDEDNVGSMPSARLSGNRVMAVTNWRRVLDGLAAINSVRSDVGQLRDLTDRMDADAFLPVRSDELTDVEVPRRLINYADLVEPIVEELKARGAADTQGLNPTHGYHTAGRYLKMRGRLGVWLGVHLHAWRDSGATPLWWVSNDTEWCGLASIWPEVDGLFDEARSYGSSKCLPIRVKAGVEREDVVTAAADQVEAIAQQLLDHLRE